MFAAFSQLLRLMESDDVYVSVDQLISKLLSSSGWIIIIILLFIIIILGRDVSSVFTLSRLF